MRTYTVNPQAQVDESDESALDRVLDVLATDDRAGDASAVASGGAAISSIFHVESDGIVDAVRLATEIFDEALDEAGLSVRTTAIAVCEGDDAERLP